MGLVKAGTQPAETMSLTRQHGLVFIPFDGALVEGRACILTDYSHRIMDLCDANNSTLIFTTHRSRAEVDVITSGYPKHFRNSTAFISEHGSELIIPTQMGVTPPKGVRSTGSHHVIPLWDRGVSLKGINNVYLQLKRYYSIVSLLDVASETLARKTNSSVLLIDALKLRRCSIPIVMKNHTNDALPLKQRLEKYNLTLVGEGSLRYIMHPSCEKSIAMGVAEVLFAESRQSVHFSVGMGIDKTDEKLLLRCDNPISISTTEAPSTEYAFNELATFFSKRKGL